jgi:hypothetical protein
LTLLFHAALKIMDLRRPNFDTLFVCCDAIWCRKSPFGIGYLYMTGSSKGYLYFICNSVHWHYGPGLVARTRTPLHRHGGGSFDILSKNHALKSRRAFFQNTKTTLVQGSLSSRYSLTIHIEPILFFIAHFLLRVLDPHKIPIYIMVKRLVNASQRRYVPVSHA